MLRVGLTGGIACGKSTVVAILRELGCLVLEADPLAHRVQQPGQPAYEEVLREFGRGILAADGAIDRKKLGPIVFADPAKRGRLNQIVHPHVIAAQEAQLDAWERERADLGIIEAPLLIEAGYHARMDRVVVVWCTRGQQMARLLARGMSPADAFQRIAAQMPVEEKRRLAQDSIDCSGTMEHTRAQTEALVARLRKGPSRR